MTYLIIGAIVATAAGGIIAYVLHSDSLPDDSDRDSGV